MEGRKLNAKCQRLKAEREKAKDEFKSWVLLRIKVLEPRWTIFFITYIKVLANVGKVHSRSENKCGGLE